MDRAGRLPPVTPHRILHYSREQFFNIARNIAMRRSRGLSFCIKDKCKGLFQLSKHVTDRFSTKTFDAIALDCLSSHFRRDRASKFRMLASGNTFRDKRKVRSMHPPNLRTPHLREICARQSVFQHLCYADRRLRPFRRLRTKIARPVRVFLRLIKPCARARFRFLGW